MLFPVCHEDTVKLCCLSFKNAEPPLMIDKSAMSRFYSGMMSKIKGTNVIWMPWNLALDFGRLDSLYERRLILDMLQNVDTSIGPAFRVLQCI